MYDATKDFEERGYDEADELSALYAKIEDASYQDENYQEAGKLLSIGLTLMRTIKRRHGDTPDEDPGGESDWKDRIGDHERLRQQLERLGHSDDIENSKILGELLDLDKLIGTSVANGEYADAIKFLDAALMIIPSSSPSGTPTTGDAAEPTEHTGGGETPAPGTTDPVVPGVTPDGPGGEEPVEPGGISPATASISGSVGKGGKNKADDVTTVQQLLNQNGAAPALEVDGAVGPETNGAISKFQQNALGFQDGRVDPDGRTWGALTGGGAGATAGGESGAAAGGAIAAGAAAGGAIAAGAAAGGAIAAGAASAGGAADASVIDDLVDDAKEFIEDLVEGAKEVYEKGKDYLDDDNPVPPTEDDESWYDKAKDYVDEAGEAVDDAVDWTVDNVKKGVEVVTDAAREALEEAAEGVSDDDAADAGSAAANIGQEEEEMLQPGPGDGDGDGDGGGKAADEESDAIDQVLEVVEEAFEEVVEKGEEILDDIVDFFSGDDEATPDNNSGGGGGGGDDDEEEELQQ